MITQFRVLSSIGSSGNTNFAREIKTMINLRHPNITTIMGACIEKGGNPLLIMEFMDRGSLYDLIHNSTFDLDGPMIFSILKVGYKFDSCVWHRLMQVYEPPGRDSLLDPICHAGYCSRDAASPSSRNTNFAPRCQESKVMLASYILLYICVSTIVPVHWEIYL